jgi:hypothetical protein
MDAFKQIAIIGVICPLLILNACAQSPPTPSVPAQSASVSSPTATSSPTAQPSASPLASVRSLAAPADSADLIGEMQFRSSIGVTLERFIAGWNDVASEQLAIELSSITINANGSFIHNLGSQHGLLGYVTGAGDLTAIAVVDGTNLLSDRLDRALSAVTGEHARFSLITGSTPGLETTARGILIEEIGSAIRLTTGDEFFYDTDTTYSTISDGIVYYLVGAADDTMWLMAVGGK